MKESFFNSDNIDIISAKILNDISSRRIKELRKRINISDSALLIVDVQKYFTNPVSHAFIPSVIPVLKRIKEIFKLFISNNQLVIFTKHIDELNNKNNMLLKWWKDRITIDNPLCEIEEEIYDKKSKVIIKTQYDAFYKTRLDMILKKHKIKKVFITGVVSNLCCETTARSAFVRGYEVYFGIDTTAAYNLLQHKSTILNISYGFGVPFVLKDLR